jgi:hypothetical protein
MLANNNYAPFTSLKLIRKEKRFDVPRLQTIIQRCRVRPQHHDQVDPAFGEQVTRVPVYYAAALLGVFLDSIEQLSFIASD